MYTDPAALNSSFTAPLTKERVEGIPWWKRSFDLGVILLGLPGLLPLMLLVAGLIKLVSPGPIFFRQERVGLRGRTFTLVKFRSMQVAADTEIHQKHVCRLVRSNLPMTKMDSSGDPRLIPFGGWLRSTGLDELPQIINILRGEMSLVGPRPCTPYEYQFYDAIQRRRSEVLPGLTGNWQVSGKNKTTFAEMIELDISYARSASPWMDLKIILLTVPAVLNQVKELRIRKSGKQLTPNPGPAPDVIQNR